LLYISVNTFHIACTGRGRHREAGEEKVIIFYFSFLHRIMLNLIEKNYYKGEK